MKPPLTIIRPQPGWNITAAAASTMDIAIAGHPMFAVEAVDWAAPDASAFDGILAGSANAFRHGGAQLEALRQLPVHAVGMATADAARAAGFTIADMGKGGLQVVVDRLGAGKQRMLRLSGEERVELALPSGVEIVERTLYRTRALPMDGELAAALAKGGVVALHSGAAAAHFRDECARHGIDLSAIAILALGPRIADMAGGGWHSIHIAPTSGDEALLALAAPLCQNTT